ncbi:hypothetical protein FGE12_10735 [Aggregicoccus sp. 17bor-14]|uniref:hypothetical protein n=1 Tax=Myxococcaceae TaxID=31 RepID=UPI00129D0EC1|nr:MULTISPECIES: hypothetical protein [Myxococcaceae]MBF5042865.1 hypothetical protein [Simulacricoccus sp. 17bor-14]MRI88632.1 hypothetical protein [Aggregicoccus sp. 17bor-14]
MLLSLLLAALAALPSSAAPRPPCEARLEAAGSAGVRDVGELVLDAGRCRAEDAVIAFGLSQRALALAPDAPGVRLAHARSLLALGERGAAAQLLDEALRTPGDGGEERLLRAELARDEGEPEQVVRLLETRATPRSARAQALLGEARAQLPARSEARQQLAELARAQQAREREAALREPPPARLRRGREAWGTRGVVESGGQRTFRLHNVRAGETYVLLATGQCTLPSPSAHKGHRRKTSPAPRDLFGVDFRARVGGLEAWPLRVGLDPERSAYTFRAPEDDPQLFIEDASASAHVGVRCSVRDLAVRAP